MAPPPGHHAHDHAADDLLPRLLALDAILHRGLLDEAIEAVAAHTGPLTALLDVGAGVGTGTFALAARFADALVTAVDSSAEMLASVRAGAAARGLAGRVTTLRADASAPDGWFVEPVDLVWTANALHEVTDPTVTLRNMRRSLRPGGVLAVLEMNGPPMVLPAEFSALETALRSAAGADSAPPDWAPLIADAGFTLVEQRSLVGDQLLAADGPGGEYAALELRRLARHGGDALPPADRSRLRAIVTDLNERAAGRPGHWRTVHIRGSRTLWLARRP